MNVYQYAGDNPVMMNDPSGGKSSQVGGTSYGTNHAVTGFSNHATEFDDEFAAEDALDSYLYGVGGGALSSPYSSFGGFDSWSEIAETADYLLNNTPYGGYSTTYNTINEYTKAGYALSNEYNLYAANGGTQSFAQVLGNYNVFSYIISIMYNTDPATHNAQLLSGGTPDYNPVDYGDNQGNEFDVTYGVGYDTRKAFMEGFPIVVPTSGASLVIGFTAPANYNTYFKSYTWIQAYQSSATNMQWVTDGTTPPFYYTPTDPQTAGNYDAYFHDFANSTAAIEWHAQLVLLGESTNNSYTVLAIFNWGYTTTVGGGTPKLDPFGSGPSQSLNPYTQGLINKLP